MYNYIYKSKDRSKTSFEKAAQGVLWKKCKNTFSPNKDFIGLWGDLIKKDSFCFLFEENLVLVNLIKYKGEIYI